MRRDGFTLIEMLAALAVFMIGFVAVYGVFLTAVRYRRIAEDTVRSSIAASSLIAEWRLRASAGAGEEIPKVGDANVDKFQHLSDQPGLYWRVTFPPKGETVHRLQFVSLGMAVDAISEDDVVRRLNRSGDFQQLIDRQVVLEYPFVIR